MKKTLIAVAAAAALATSSAFAEITFGAWLRTITGVGYNGKDAVTGMSNSWGGMRPARLNATWNSDDGMAGMKIDMYFDAFKAKNGDDESAVISVGDNAYLWLKPIDMIQLSIGKFDGAETGFRGDFCYGSWNWLRPGNWIRDDEGLTFHGSWTNGLMVKVTPVENLVVLVALPVYNSVWGGKNTEWADGDDNTTVAGTFKNADYMASYQIEGIGKIKAGFFGNNIENDDKKDADGIGEINVAFDLTAVENLYATVGFFYGLYDENAWNDVYQMMITAGVSYQITDAFKVSVSGGVKTFQNSDYDPQFGVGAGIDYAIMDGLAAVADVRFLSGLKNDKLNVDKDETISFLVGLNKSVGSNGSLGIGFQGATNGNGLTGIAAQHDADEKNDKFVWAVPVSMSIWF